MAKRQTAQPTITADQGRHMVGLITQHMHLIPDMALEYLVESLTAEMRRRGLIHDGFDDDEAPF